MLPIDIFCSLISLIVCAHITESKLYILRDYDNELTYINAEDRRLHNDYPSPKHKSSEAGYKQKRKPRQAIVHYGRHIYHLDSFEDLTKLRSHLNPDYISYDYFDINDLYRTSNSIRSIPWDYIEDIVVLTGPIGKICKDKNCDDNLRKYNDMFKLKHDRNDRGKWDSEKNVNKIKIHGRQNTNRPDKRFKIVDNSKHSKSKVARKPMNKRDSRSSEEYDKKKPTHNKKKIDSSESASSSSTSSSEESKESKDWSVSDSESEEKVIKKKKKKYVSSSEEDTKYTSPKKRKKQNNFDNDFDSFESKMKLLDSNSIEESWQKKKKKKKNYSSEEQRKTFKNEEMILQGNNLYDIHGLSDDADEDRRRRLPQFLPKRYHWDPSDINELGYYWFNGPKGRYPSPTPLRR